MNNKKKAVYLGIIAALFIFLITILFIQRSTNLRRSVVGKELQKKLLTYIEKEEKYPESLEKIEFNSRGLKIQYERLGQGRGCRFTIAGKKYELWDEKR